MKGCLTTIKDGVKCIAGRPSVIKGNYPGIYDAVYRTIRGQATFPVTREQATWQIELLESA
ncbi:hypothetical protein ABIC45_002886 [Mucilaginibacter rubeus]|uniref:hypothetical protein n=1 Tax=Mucilaginibacter rubeus TaxID=2027860 RepID=UPI0033925404